MVSWWLHYPRFTGPCGGCFDCVPHSARTNPSAHGHWCACPIRIAPYPRGGVSWWWRHPCCTQRSRLCPSNSGVQRGGAYNAPLMVSITTSDLWSGCVDSYRNSWLLSLVYMDMGSAETSQFLFQAPLLHVWLYRVMLVYIVIILPQVLVNYLGLGSAEPSLPKMLVCTLLCHNPGDLD